MTLFLQVCRFGRYTGISFVDSTCIPVCHNKRIKRNRVFKDYAVVGRSTMGWYFGFKLHPIVNERGEVLNFMPTKVNVDDKDENVFNRLSDNVFGKLFADKGYISQGLFDKLFNNAVQFCYRSETRHAKQAHTLVWQNSAKEEVGHRNHQWRTQERHSTGTFQPPWRAQFRNEHTRDNCGLWFLQQEAIYTALKTKADSWPCSEITEAELYRIESHPCQLTGIKGFYPCFKNKIQGEFIPNSG